MAPDRPDPEFVFTNVFEELLRPEVESRVPWWAWVGAMSGAGIGFIIANLPGEWLCSSEFTANGHPASLPRRGKR